MDFEAKAKEIVVDWSPLFSGEAVTVVADALRAAGWVRAADAREVAGRAVVQAVAATLEAAGVAPNPDLYKRVAAQVRASLVPWPTPVEVPPAPEAPP